MYIGLGFLLGLGLELRLNLVLGGLGYRVVAKGVRVIRLGFRSRTKCIYTK